MSARLHMPGRLGTYLQSLLATRLTGFIRRPRGARTLGAPAGSAALRQRVLGVNVAGYIAAESGMGEATRGSVRAIEAAGIPIALNDVVVSGAHRTSDRSYTRFDEANPYAFNLVHLNAENMVSFAAQRGADYFRNRYTIGAWFWELAEFPQEWSWAFDYVQEVWAASRFIRTSIAARSPVDVTYMPPAIVLPPGAALGRSHFSLRPDTFVFLFAFDISSQAHRKNPFAVVDAFRHAGFRAGEATLVLKYTKPEFDIDAVRQLHQRAAGLEVVALEGYMHRDELGALMRCCDCYVSLHRSEGFGLTLAEAMALGKPTIATNYGGNTDFMTKENSYPVSYRLVELTSDHGPYRKGSHWADPDLPEAARYMREVAREPERAREVGSQARASILREYSPERRGAAMRERLERLFSG